MYSDEQVEAFWSKVNRQNRLDCWEWQGTKNPKGYGNIRINKKYTHAHRVAWEMANFKIPDGYCVCHVCDNPACCNPSHLMLGTISSNYVDMVMKNRDRFKKNKAIGERNTNAKLTKSAVIEIRTSTDTSDALAEKFGVRRETINCVRRGDTWKHVKTGVENEQRQ